MAGFFVFFFIQGGKKEKGIYIYASFSFFLVLVLRVRREGTLSFNFFMVFLVQKQRRALLQIKETCKKLNTEKKFLTDFCLFSSQRMKLTNFLENLV